MKLGQKISDVKGRGHALTLHREDIFAGHLSGTDVGSRIMPELRRFKQPPIWIWWIWMDLGKL